MPMGRGISRAGSPARGGHLTYNFFDNRLKWFDFLCKINIIISICFKSYHKYFRYSMYYYF